MNPLLPSEAVQDFGWKGIPLLAPCPPWGPSPMGSTSSPEDRTSFLAQGLICLLRYKSCWRRLPHWAQRCGRHLTWSPRVGCCHLPCLPAAAREMTCSSLLLSCCLLVPPSPLQGLQQANALPLQSKGVHESLAGGIGRDLHSPQ